MRSATASRGISAAAPDITTSSAPSSTPGPRCAVRSHLRLIGRRHHEHHDPCDLWGGQAPRGMRGIDMYPRKFDYVAPTSLEEAFDALGDDAKVLAGGMSLIPLMKLRLFSPGLVVDIGRISGLDSIEESNGEIEIGALVRHVETANSELVKMNARALATAASLTGDVQVRNRGTTCGALAHADVAADQPAGAIACGAVMIAQSSSGIREIPSSEFFVDSLTSALETDEILTSIRIPKAGSGEASAYEKLGRRGGLSDYAVAAAAAWIRRPDDTIEDARIAVTGVGTKPTSA